MLRKNDHSGERFQLKQGLCDRHAQSLLEVISEQSVGRMKGQEIHSVILDKTNKKKEGGMNSCLENTHACLALTLADFQHPVYVVALLQSLFRTEFCCLPPTPGLDEVQGWTCRLPPWLPAVWRYQMGTPVFI